MKNALAAAICTFGALLLTWSIVKVQQDQREQDAYHARYMRASDAYRDCTEAYGTGDMPKNACPQLDPYRPAPPTASDLADEAEMERKAAK